MQGRPSGSRVLPDRFACLQRSEQLFPQPRDVGARVRAVLAHVWDDTESVDSEKRWVVVNDIKYLFHTWQKWDRQEARDFVHAAWPYVKL